jgi:hypothetical protein
MNLRLWNYAELAAMLIVGGAGMAYAGEPARQRGTPIIFSEPKSDTVSSNLNQLDLNTSPFKGLESDLKKPFEIFDSGRSIGSFRPPAGLSAPPAAPVNNRRIQELIDRRAEMMLPGPESGDPDLADDDPFKASEDTQDAAGRKLKTPLDRYYDRLDRERAAFTNEVRNPELFGNNDDPDDKDQFGRTFLDKPFAGDLKASVNSLGRQSNNVAASSGFFPDQLKPKTFDDLFHGQPNDLGGRSSGVKDTRLDEFKRLLDRPAYTPGTNFYSPGLPAAGAALRAVPAAPWPARPATSASGNPRDTFTSRAGLVGALPELQSLPSLATPAPSLNPTPPPLLPPKRPTSSFSIPKRQF